MKNALGILLVIAIVIIFLQQMCKPAVKDNTGTEALIKAKDDTIALYRQTIAKDSIAINEAGQTSAESRQKEELYRKESAAQQLTINRLVAKIEAAKKETDNGTFVKVSPNYVEGCDSLTEQNKSLAVITQQLEDQNAESTKLMLYEIALRDSALNTQKEFNKKFLDQLDNCMAQLHGKVNAKQRAQIYAGFGLFGNQINPIAGGQVNVSLRARNSQIYEITGATVGNTWYAGVGTKFLITLRK